MREIKFRTLAKDGKTLIYSDNLGLSNFFHGYKDEEVMQFTGLKDKNGKEIYEGDVVNIKSNYETDEPVDCNAKVFFKDGSFRTDFHDGLLAMALPGNWILENIGTVYENPELLK